MRSVATHSILVKTLLQLRIVVVVLTDRLRPLTGLPIGSYLVKDFNFVVSSFQVVLSTFLDLDCHVAVELEILG